MNFYNLNSNIAIIKAWIQLQPRAGYGIANQLATRLNLSSVLISQILSEKRSLQLEKAIELAEIMNLDPNEKEYFLLLTELQNSGSEKLKKHFQKKISQLKARLSDLKENVRNEKDLNETAKAQFYSNWIYSAIRLSTDISDYKTSRSLAERFQVPIEDVNFILEFLVEHGLCSKKGIHYNMAAQNTHLESSSPWVYSRQLQWRVKAQQNMQGLDSKNIFYTGPMVLSKEGIQKIREKLIKSIKECTEIARDSKSEQLYCLNIDWFEV